MIPTDKEFLLGPDAVGSASMWRMNAGEWERFEETVNDLRWGARPDDIREKLLVMRERVREL